MKKIGGFFEFEIAEGKSLYHDDALKLSTGRACLNVIIQEKKYKKIYIPFFCCDALFEPMVINNIPFEFYPINDKFEIEEEISLNSDEAIIYCDFFGVKSDYIYQLIDVYNEQLIIDNSHSFFKKGYNSNASFTTARKYFGVPDGAYLYLPNAITDFKPLRNTAVSINHNIYSFLGMQDIAFDEFQTYEKSLNSKITLISKLSEKVLKTVNYNHVRLIRNNNFNFYQKEMSNINMLTLGGNLKDCFCYPLLLEKPILKQKLFDNKIFIPSYWPDVTKRNQSNNYRLESYYSEHILHLPIDHRYSIDELERVIRTIKDIIDEK